VDNATEYSVVVGDLDGDVTNADLMNFFRNPNLGLRGDFIDPSIHAIIQRTWLTRRTATATATGREGRDGSDFCHRSGGE
jgi:hypothetical protein